MSDQEDFNLNDLNDEDLVAQVHDDLYNGLKDEVVEATNIFLSRGWGADKVLNDALVEGMRIVGIDFRDDAEALEIWREAGADVQGERVQFPRGICRTHNIHLFLQFPYLNTHQFFLSFLDFC
jgi:methanogenic corrinoid protein MtbC1